MLAKLGFSARDVWQMSHLEASSWIRAYLGSQGEKVPKGKIQFDPATTIISMRRPKTAINTE